MERRKKAIMWAVIMSESTHIFCCVLPTVFSILSLLAGAGMISAMPGFMVDFHEVMHGYEVPMIVVSGLILAFGWGFHWYSEKIDCHDTGCGHGPCEPKKNKTHVLLLLASILFLVNVTVYIVFHRGVEVMADAPMLHDHSHSHDEHDHGHDH